MPRRQASGVLLFAAVLAASGACSEGDGSGNRTGSEGKASCAVRIKYDGRTYSDVANVEFKVGSKLGIATQPACNDTGSDTVATASERTAYRVKGLAPEVAIAVGDSAEDAMFVAVRNGKDLPPEVEKLIHGS